MADGWGAAAQYVGERLRTARLDYEETGWYDGATFHKPQEVLVRDRLLAAYEVRLVARVSAAYSGRPNPSRVAGRSWYASAVAAVWKAAAVRPLLLRSYQQAWVMQAWESWLDRYLALAL